MKSLQSIRSILFVALILLSACANGSSINEAGGSDTSYPTGGTGSNADYPIAKANADPSLAYPIPEEDLKILVGSWILTSRTENNVAQELVEKRLILDDDGRYELDLPDGKVNGVWSASATLNEAILIFDLGTDRANVYEIMEISEGHLHIKSDQDGLVINEFYRPAD